MISNKFDNKELRSDNSILNTYSTNETKNNGAKYEMILKDLVKEISSLKSIVLEQEYRIFNQTERQNKVENLVN